MGPKTTFLRVGKNEGSLLRISFQPVQPETEEYWHSIMHLPVRLHWRILWIKCPFQLLKHVKLRLHFHTIPVDHVTSQISQLLRFCSTVFALVLLRRPQKYQAAASLHARSRRASMSKCTSQTSLGERHESLASLIDFGRNNRLPVLNGGGSIAGGGRGSVYRKNENVFL